MSLMIIRMICHIPLNLPIFAFFENMVIDTFDVHSNPPLNTVQLTALEAIRFHENREIIPSGDSYDLSPGK